MKIKLANKYNILSRYFVFVLSIAFILIGVFRGDEVLTMFTKAINICLECIGVG